MLSVTADRAHHQRQPAAPRVEQPPQAIVLRCVFDLGREPALDVFDLHQPQRTQRAVADQLACVARHRVRRIAVRDREQAPLPARARDEIAGLREIVRDRLVAKNVESGIERCRSVRIMRVVRRHDRDRVDAIGARALLVEQLAHCTVGTRWVESQLGAGRA